MASIESYTKRGIDAELNKKSDKTHRLEDHPDWPGATPEATGRPNTLVKRDGSGRFYVATPEHDYQPATKLYVDNALSSFSGGMSLVEDPPGSGLFTSLSGGVGLVEDPPGSGLFAIT
jgi:hypothetical protein